MPQPVLAMAEFPLISIHICIFIHTVGIPVYLPTEIQPVD